MNDVIWRAVDSFVPAGCLVWGSVGIALVGAVPLISRADYSDKSGALMAPLFHHHFLITNRNPSSFPSYATFKYFFIITSEQPPSLHPLIGFLNFDRGCSSSQSFHSDFNLVILISIPTTLIPPLISPCFSG